MDPRDQIAQLSLMVYIYNEYKPHMPFRSFARQWWIRLGQFGKVSYLPSNIPKSVEKRLIDILEFDSDDIKFVGVAHRASSHRLVSKDSGYTPPIVDCLRQKLGMMFYDIPSACAECS